MLANPGGVRPALPPQYVQAAKDNVARLQLCPPDIFAALQALIREQPDTRFRHRLTCRRILEAMNSADRGSAQAARKYPVNWAYMNPEDMREEGIAEQALIEIQSEAGHIVGVATADAGLRRGVVSMTHLYGSLEASTDPRRQRGSYTSRLTSLRDYLEPINCMPRFSGIPVNVRPAGGADDHRHAPRPTGVRIC